VFRATRFSMGREELVVMSYEARDIDDPRLGAAEREVLCHLLDGKSNAEIAHLRGTSLRTVANQIASVFRKLGVVSRAEIAAHYS